MDGLPIELVRLCRLASMAECGDHHWASVPSMLSWTAVLLPVAKGWARWRNPEPPVPQGVQSKEEPAGA